MAAAATVDLVSNVVFGLIAVIGVGQGRPGGDAVVLAATADLGGQWGWQRCRRGRRLGGRLGASGPWNSTIGSSRITRVPALTTNEFAVTR